jgi:hypothetical protein
LNKTAQIPGSMCSGSMHRKVFQGDVYPDGRSGKDTAFLKQATLDDSNHEHCGRISNFRGLVDAPIEMDHAFRYGTYNIAR